MNLRTALSQPRGGSRGETAGTNVARHHPLSGEHLEDAKDVFALAEAIEEDGHRADIERVRSQPDAVTVDALQFREQNAHHLHGFRHFLGHAQQFLDCQRVHQIVDHVRQIVDTIGERYNLLPGPRLALLFDSRMKKSDIRIGPHDRFAVKFQQHPKHAVRRRVLRTHVQGHATALRGGLLFRFQPGWPRALR